MESISCWLRKLNFNRVYANNPFSVNSLFNVTFEFYEHFFVLQILTILETAERFTAPTTNNAIAPAYLRLLCNRVENIFNAISNWTDRIFFLKRNENLNCVNEMVYCFICLGLCGLIEYLTLVLSVLAKMTKNDVNKIITSIIIET